MSTADRLIPTPIDACDADGFPVGGASFKPEFKDIVTAISAANKS